MASSFDVKMEDSPHIKPDPDAAQMQDVMEDDEAYEDTAELELPKELDHAQLIRIPPQLHQRWSQADFETQVVVGTVRRYKKSGRQKLLLNPTLQQHVDLVKTYDMQTTDPSVTNTFVFSEKDLPGYKKGAQKAKPGQEAANGKVDKNQRFFRRMIPKQTALKALITTESNCKAEDNAENNALLRQRMEAQEHRRPKLEFLDLDPRTTEGMSLNAERNSFNNFVKPLAAKAKPQENKTARMPRNELFDLIFKCFDEYKYWGLASMKERTQQPEAYLKETLNQVAELIKTGPNAGKYMLGSGMNRDIASRIKEEQIKDEDGGDDSDLDLSDDDEDKGEDI